ncbi:MAG: KH domain-containing protein [Candidatus Micrarchaeia archaeon]
MAEILLPGNKVMSGVLKANGVYTEGGDTYADVVGMLNDERKQFIPLEGLWYPKENDRVIGRIETKRMSAYIMDLKSPYKGIILTKYERTRFDEGDIAEATVREFREFDDAMAVMLVRPRKLYGGILLNIKPPKVPRVIGRGNTMLNQIAEATKSSIVVGMNGTIWLKGGDIGLATAAIKEIEAQAHVSGLTERIKRMLDEHVQKRDTWENAEGV